MMITTLRHTVPIRIRAGRLVLGLVLGAAGSALVWGGSALLAFADDGFNQGHTRALGIAMMALPFLTLVLLAAIHEPATDHQDVSE